MNTRQEEFRKDAKERSQNCMQDFTESKENYKITQYGETYPMYDFIQDNRIDTEIIPTLEKYGVAKGMEKLKRYDPENAEKYYGDFRSIKGDFRNLLDQQIAAEKMWKSLPLDLRAKFGHSQKEFLEKGEKWLKSEMENFKKANTFAATETATTATTATTTAESKGE